MDLRHTLGIFASAFFLIVSLWTVPGAFASPIYSGSSWSTSVGYTYFSFTGHDATGAVSHTTLTGPNLRAAYFFTEAVALAFEGHLLSGIHDSPSFGYTAAPLYVNPMMVQLELHGSFADNFGGYLGIGLVSTSGGGIGGRAVDGGGLIEEAGLEYRLAGHWVGKLSYKWVHLGPFSSPNYYDGISAGVNYIF